MTDTIFTTFKSANRIALKIYGYDEPNNGRELWIADLQINNKSANNLFRQEWNRLNFRLDQYQFASADEQFVFIPAESESFLIHAPTLEVYYLEPVPLSTLGFKGNYFYQHKLIIAYRDFFTVHDPVKKEMQQYGFSNLQLVDFAGQDGLFTAFLQEQNSKQTKEEQFLIL
jgi:hypothetical protein